jgi:hypothetical protein
LTTRPVPNVDETWRYELLFLVRDLAREKAALDRRRARGHDVSREIRDLVSQIAELKRQTRILAPLRSVETPRRSDIAA